MGPEAGEPVTLLHGFMQTRRSWDGLLPLLPAGRRWILVDLPGHGGSVDAEPTLAATAAALLELWDAAGVDRTHLVGYSMGGRTALFTAACAPRRLLSLLTIGAHAGFEGEARRRRLEEDAALAARIEREGMDWFATHWAGRPMFAGLARRGPAVLAELDAMRRRLDPAGVAASLRGMGGAASEPFWDRLDAIACRCTFVAGAEDGTYVAHARRLAAAVPAGRVEIVPGAGHAAHLERPERFAKVLVDHLSSR